MEAMLYILARTVQLILSLVTGAMIVRMFLPLFVNPEESRLYVLLCYVTEPFITPVRVVMYKCNWGQDSPFDFAFTITYLLLVALRFFLPVVG